MATDDGDLNRVWQQQPIEEGSMTLDDIRTRVTAWERRIARRNLREYVAAVVVFAGFGFVAWRDPNWLVRIGAGLVVLGTCYVVWHLYTRGSTRAMPASLAARDCLDFHRSELVRQRDLLRSVWTWYLLPFVPGVAVMMIGRVALEPGRRVAVLASTALMAAVFVWVGRLNQRGARKLQAKIDALDQAR
jgi:hypothetical protein